jgi:ribosomal protein L22
VTPSNPQDPPKGKVADDVGQTEAQAEETKATVPAEEAAQKAPAPKRPRKKATPEAEETAAAETGVDKAAAEAAKPRTRRKPGARAPGKTAEEKAQAKPKTASQPARRRRRDVEPGVIVRAQARYVRTSARKARLVCDHLRGKDVAEARAILAFTPRAVAEAWTKLLESAVANAEHNHELDSEDLRVHRVYADEGPTLKRFRPRAMGRATRIRKRTSHLTIELTPKEQ